MTAAAAVAVAASLTTTASSASDVDEVSTLRLRHAVTVDGVLASARVLRRFADQNGGARASGTVGARTDTAGVRSRGPLLEDRVTREQSPSAFPAAGERTRAELWARRDGAGVGTAAAHLMSKQTTTSPAGWALRAGADDRWSCSRADLATLTAAVSPDPVPRNVWTHVACTYDGTALRLYLDGARVAAVPDPAPLPDTTALLTIGASPGGAMGWSGAADEAAVYDRALSAAEIVQHWAAR